MKILCSILGLAVCAIASSQFQTGFEASEGYSGSTTGVVITGQNLWYIPVSGSADGKIFVSAGNSLGAVANPLGGDQFLANIADSTFTGIVSRSQHDLTIPSGMVTATFDFCPLFTAAPPSTDNLGSFSLQPSTTNNYFQTLYRWADVNNPTTFIFEYGRAGAAGKVGGFVTGATDFESPGPAWIGLPINHWYRCSTTWDTATNAYVKVSLRDITAGTPEVTVNPTGWYLSGGLNNVLAQPTATALRFFAGGSATGNVVCYDNLNLNATTTETLAPTSQTVSLGKVASGSVADLGAIDGVAERICKLVVPTISSPFVRLLLNYTTTKTSATAIDLNVTAKMGNGGQFKISLDMRDQVNSTNVNVLPQTTITTTYATFTGSVTSNHNNFIGGGGAMQARVEVYRTGVSASAAPCTDFDAALLSVTG